MELITIIILLISITTGISGLITGDVIRTLNKRLKEEGKVINWKKITENYLYGFYEESDKIVKSNPLAEWFFSMLFPIYNIGKSVKIMMLANSNYDNLVEMFETIGIVEVKNKKSLPAKEVAVEKLSDEIRKAKNLVINASRADVVIEGCRSSLKPTLSVYYKEDTLSDISSYISANIINGQLIINEKFLGEKGATKIEISLCRNQIYKKITLKTFSGIVKVRYFSNGQLYISTLSGSIKLYDINASTALTTISGNIDATIDSSREDYYINNNTDHRIVDKDELQKENFSSVSVACSNVKVLDIKTLTGKPNIRFNYYK